MIGVLHGKIKDRHTNDQITYEDEAAEESLLDHDSSDHALAAEDGLPTDQEAVRQQVCNCYFGRFGVSSFYVGAH